MDWVFAVTYILLSVVAGIAGRKHRVGFWGHFSYSLMFTPLAVLVVLYVLSPRKA